MVDIKDVITFEGRRVKELENAFRESVDDYLAYCDKRGEKLDVSIIGFAPEVAVELRDNTHCGAPSPARN